MNSTAWIVGGVWLALMIIQFLPLIVQWIERRNEEPAVMKSFRIIGLLGMLFSFAFPILAWLVWPTSGAISVTIFSLIGLGWSWVCWDGWKSSSDLDQIVTG